jgi:hypothetical protein
MNSWLYTPRPLHNAAARTVSQATGALLVARFERCETADVPAMRPLMGPAIFHLPTLLYLVLADRLHTTGG